MATVGFPSLAAKLHGHRPFSSSSSSRCPSKHGAVRVCCSAEALAPGTAAEENATSAYSSSPPPLESPTGKRSSSLISAANVQKALRGIRRRLRRQTLGADFIIGLGCATHGLMDYFGMAAITDVDHYGRLGIPRGTSYNQVKVAYENKCEELMNKGLVEDEVSKEHELLKESHAILSSEDERRLYDWSLARSERPERYVWPFEADITQTPTQPPPPQEPEDVGPTRLVGYFLLAWLILSFALSVTLNR